MQYCGNETLQKLLDEIVQYLKYEDKFDSENIPFYLAPIWESFNKNTDQYYDFISDLEKYPEHNISLIVFQDSIYSYEIDIYLYDYWEDFPCHYSIYLYIQEEWLGECRCKPEDADYRADKGCCGHCCNWSQPGFELKKEINIARHEWTGDEHDIWLFEDKFYTDEKEVRKKALQEQKERAIKELQDRIECDKKQLEKLLEEE